MKCIVKHQVDGRMRVVVVQETKMTFEEADILENYLLAMPNVSYAKVNERTHSATIEYKGNQRAIKQSLANFAYDQYTDTIYDTGRQSQREFEEKLAIHILKRFCVRLFVPSPIRSVHAVAKAIPHIYKGVKSLAHGKLEVATLDATSILISLLQKKYTTAGSIMFLLELSDILEDWTHKKTVEDLARSMAIQVEHAWVVLPSKEEILTPVEKIQVKDKIHLRKGYMIPLDGVVESREASVNQATLTGESMPVHKKKGSLVYAGTTMEEGECIIRVTNISGEGRFDRIIQMIEDSEKLKSSVERRAELLADCLVPYSFLITGITYLLTRDINRAVSVLMVDYSCALKLSIPIAVLSAINECVKEKITVKGGKYLELISEVDTVVFDKTGTLTYSFPKVAQIVTFNGYEENEVLRLAACLEEHYPHVVANAIVEEAKRRNLKHEEEHSKVEYIVAHGIKSSIHRKPLLLGSYHFIFEDEKYKPTKAEEKRITEISDEYTSLYFVINHKLAAVICIEEPERKEAKQVIQQLRNLGVSKVIMMTGDSNKTARAVAKRLNLDEYYAEVLPEDKANLVKQEKALGRKVLMVGDGINDTLALSEADIGVAIGDGAEIAREIADITISSDDLTSLATLREKSDLLMKRINQNYRFIMSFNSALILLGAFGVLPSTTTSYLHNGSTLLVGIKSTTKLS